jgi:hypothetical protein
MLFWFSCPLWARMLNISSCIYWPFSLFFIFYNFCLVHLLIYWMDFWLFVGLVFELLHFQVINSLSDVLLTKIFSYSRGCLFSLVTACLAMQKCLSLTESHLSIFSLNCWATGVLLRMLLPALMCFSVFSVVIVSQFHIFQQDLWSTLNWYKYKVRDWDIVSIFCRWISSFPQPFFA